jgi:hypothetical protein
MVMKVDAERAGMGFTAPRAVLTDDVFLQGPSIRKPSRGVLERMTGLERITFGGKDSQLGARIPGGGADLAATVQAEGARARLDLDVGIGDGGAAGLALQTSFAAATRDAAEIMRRVRRLVRGEEYGEAFRLCQEVVVAYSFCEAEVLEAQDVLKDLEGKAREFEASAFAAFEAGRDFLDDAELAKAEEMASRMAVVWRDRPRGERAEKLLADVRALRAERAKAAIREVAAGALLRAEDFEAVGRTHLARAMYRAIVMHGGGTEEAAKAREALERLGE